MPEDVIVRSVFCALPSMPRSLSPVVMMLAVEVMVTVPPLLEAKMPLALVAMIANGPGSTFTETAPLLGEEYARDAGRRRDVGDQIEDIERSERA